MARLDIATSNWELNKRENITQKLRNVAVAEKQATHPFFIYDGGNNMK